MNISLIHYGGFFSKEIISYFSDNGYRVSLISYDYFNNQDKINIKLKDADIIMHIIDDYFYSLKSRQYEASLDIFRDVMEKIKIAINHNELKQKLFIQTSLSLIYKNKSINDETSISFSNSLISNISSLVEEKANSLRENDIRVLILRMANVLSENGGMTKKINTFSKFKFLPKVFKSKKYVDWIHIDDALLAIDFLISNNHFGVFNITSPSLGIYKELLSICSKSKERFSLPSFLFKKFFFYGYLSSLQDIKVVPKRLLENGFNFKYSKLSSIEFFQT